MTQGGKKERRKVVASKVSFTFPTVLSKAIVLRAQGRILFLSASLVPSHTLTLLTLTATLRSRQERDYCLPFTNEETEAEKRGGVHLLTPEPKAEPRSPDQSQEPTRSSTCCMLVVVEGEGRVCLGKRISINSLALPLTPRSSSCIL